MQEGREPPLMKHLKKKLSLSSLQATMGNEAQTYVIYVIIFFVLTLVLQFFFHKPSRRTTGRRLPPTPPSLPLLGHLHLLNPSLYRSFCNLSSKYGPLIHLRLGAVRCIVVSSAALATEIFKTQDLAFSSRPKFAFSDETPYGSSGFFAAPYGDYWRFMKKLTMSELLSPKQVERSRSVRQEEIRRFLSKMAEKAEKKEIIEVGSELMKLTNNSICRMLMSMRCSDDNDEAEKIRELVKDTMEVGAKVAFGDVIGWPLKRVAFWLYGQQAIDVTLRYDAILEKALKQHEERAEREGFDREEDRDLMDIILKVYKDKNAEFKITRTNVKAFLLDLFVGGTGTSTEVMQWVVAELINHPKEMNKLREEIYKVVGKTRLIQDTDVPNLPYLQAAVKEGLRMYPAVPITMRGCRESCKINGYDIPENTMVAVNLFAIMRDPEVWENPNEFNPERFLVSGQENDKIKQIQYEIKGQNFSFVPFGGGRRGCPGSTLAFTTITSVVGALVQCFDLKVDGEDGATAKMEIGPGLGLPMARPLNCVPVLRCNPFQA